MEGEAHLWRPQKRDSDDSAWPAPKPALEKPPLQQQSKSKPASSDLPAGMESVHAPGMQESASLDHVSPQELPAAAGSPREDDVSSMRPSTDAGIVARCASFMSYCLM